MGVIAPPRQKNFFLLLRALIYLDHIFFGLHIFIFSPLSTPCSKISLYYWLFHVLN